MFKSGGAFHGWKPKKKLPSQTAFSFSFCSQPVVEQPGKVQLLLPA
jgi:hypothetical protein